MYYSLSKSGTVKVYSRRNLPVLVLVGTTAVYLTGLLVGTYHSRLPVSLPGLLSRNYQVYQVYHGLPGLYIVPIYRLPVYLVYHLPVYQVYLNWSTTYSPMTGPPAPASKTLKHTPNHTRIYIYTVYIYILRTGILVIPGIPGIPGIRIPGSPGF
jgi:hypothetical protein